MADEHWQRVREVFDAALRQDPEKREKYIKELCGEDKCLLAEVESLFSSFDKFDDFMEEPAVNQVADMIEASTKRLSAGTRFAHYEIVRPIGVGGMGEVYLARDTNLKRPVALKLLPAMLSSHKESLDRLKREALAASSLNHPNILTIYEIGADQELHFIATEFIDGVSLRRYMQGKTLELTDILDIVVQIAAALATAHAAGIVHRDIKPDNIMIRRDGLVKVLDFGLAKPLWEGVPRLNTSALTEVRVKTEAGAVLGTASYMSPEQARGAEQVDKRSDIWSLGVTLYELICGQAPFTGETRNDVIAAILKADPPLLSTYVPDLPAELERIVTRTLEKNKEERYQVIKDLELDLKRFRQRLGVESELKRFGQKVVTDGLIAPATQTNAATATGTTLTNSIIIAIKRRPLWAILVAAALIVATVTVGYLVYSRRLVADTAVDPDSRQVIRSIAVLPFTNTTGDSETEYLSDGITDSLIESLSQLPSLKVMSRNSVFRYKGKETDAKAVGRELGVRVVLTGRLWQRGDNLYINVELVDAGDNSHLWGQRYNRKLSDVIAIESEIAREISQHLRMKLTGEEQKRVNKSYTANAEAYQLYLRGRYYWHKFTEDDFKRALDYFQQAIDKDPNYALAYAGLADCYWQLGWYSYLPKKEAWPKSKAAIERALERDSTIAEVHTSLAAHKVIEGDYEGAEVELQQALSLYSGNAQTHMQYSWYLDGIGQVEKAIEEAKKAYELDPLSPVVVSSLGQAFFFGRRYDEAIEAYQEVLRSDPNSSENHAYLGSAFEQKRMYEDAIKEFLKARDYSVEKTGIGMLGHCYAVSGRTSEAQRLIQQLLRETPARSYALALIYTGLGDKDSAFLWLNKTLDDEDHRNQLLFIKVDPIFDGLRTDQRFTELLRRMKLPIWE